LPARVARRYGRSQSDTKGNDMSDPQNPADPPPASNVPPAPPAYGQPQYASAPPPAYAPPADATVPGRTMGIVAFILSFFVQLIALILGIVALVQSRKAGQKNGWALAAIIISSVLIVVGIIVTIIIVSVVFGGLAAACAELGPGVHTLQNGGTITCS
jgi:hypothetical protein